MSIVLGDRTSDDSNDANRRRSDAALRRFVTFGSPRPEPFSPLDSMTDLREYAREANQARAARRPEPIPVALTGRAVLEQLPGLGGLAEAERVVHGVLRRVAAFAPLTIAEQVIVARWWEHVLAVREAARAQRLTPTRRQDPYPGF